MSESQSKLETIPLMIKVGSGTLEVDEIECNFNGDYDVTYKATDLYRPREVRFTFDNLETLARLMKDTGAEVAK